MDRGVSWAKVHGVAKSQKRLSIHLMISVERNAGQNKYSLWMWELRSVWIRGLTRVFPGSVNAVGTGLGPHIIHVPTSTLGGPHPDCPFADEETESQVE